ncbi:MAG: hypothetical protein RSC45_08075 [Acinetobacter sp.]|jgi:hypothetical protein
MHDWLLLSIDVDWIQSNLKVHLKNTQSEDKILLAEEFTAFQLSRKNEWGKSVSINQIINFSTLKNGNSFIQIEIQSGDLLEIEAKNIQLT